MASATEHRRRVIRLADARREIDHEDEPPRFDASFAAMTRAVHGGEAPQASAVPIHLGNSVGESWAYSRYLNPTVQAFETKVRELEGGAGSVATASGMAAISQTLLGLLARGDRLLVHRDLFVGTRTLLADYLPAYGIEVVAVDMRDPERLARELETPTRAVLFEAISHGAMEVLDAPALLAAARRAGVLSLVDNTLLTPALFRPLEAGADVVLHSASKSIGGHGDALGGVVTARDPEVARRVRKARRIFGGVLAPMNAYLLLRGLKTLPMRVARCSASAARIATFLEGHPRVAEVTYPGLASSPGHAVAASYLTAFGGIVGFRLCDEADKQRLAARLRLCEVRFSFGEPSTVLLLQDEVTQIRISVGLEDPDDLVRDLAEALGA